MVTILQAEIESNKWDLENIEWSELSYAQKQAYDLIQDFQYMLENGDFENLAELFEDMKVQWENVYGMEYNRMSWNDRCDLEDKHQEDDFFYFFRWNINMVEDGVKEGIEVEPLEEEEVA